MVERWLYADHAARWFSPQEDWLEEIVQRRGKYTFIKHMVMEYEGTPIGFCQYYDCYYGQAYEDWYTAEAPGVLYSIDYLIGDPAYLRKGFGKETIRLLTEKVRTLPNAKEIIALPNAENIPSRRSLLACGYRDNGKYFELVL